MSADAIPFSTYREYKRLYSKAVVTASGVYKDGEVPEGNEGSSELTVEVVHEVLMTDSAGRIIRMVFDIPEALDRDGNKGGGYGIFAEGDPPVAVQNPYTNPEYPLTVGGATEPTKLYVRETVKLDSQNKLRTLRMVELSGGWPAPHIP